MQEKQPNNITQEFILQECIRCRKDPKYFIHNYCYITHPVRGKIKFEEAYEFQDDLLDIFAENRFSIINKSRQMGISTIVIAYCAWLMLFFKYKEIVLLSIKSEVTKELIERIQFLFDSLPPWLKPNKKAKGATFNKTSITLAETGSSIKATSTTTSVGRSFSASLLIMDEAAFIRGIKTIWTSVYPILSTGGDAIVLSTPNGATDWFCDMFTKAKQGLNKFVAIELPYYLKPEFDEAWARETKANMTKRQFRQEHECAFLGSANNIIDVDIMKELHHPRLREPLRKLQNGFMYIYEEPIEGERYVIGSDVSRGDGEDYSTFSIKRKDKESGKLYSVATFKGLVQNNIFAGYLFEAGVMYNDALLCVENNSYGWSVLMELQNLGYSNIYYSAKGQEFNTFINPESPAYRKALQHKETEMVIGFTTSSKTRPVILDKFAIAAENDKLEFYDERLEKEIQGWIWKDGRYDHEDGNHDDLIFAEAIGSFVLNQLEKIDYYDQKTDAIKKQFFAINKDIKDSKYKITEEMVKKTNFEKYKKQTRVPIANGITINLADMYDCNRFNVEKKEE